MSANVERANIEKYINFYESCNYCGSLGPLFIISTWYIGRLIITEKPFNGYKESD